MADDRSRQVGCASAKWPSVPLLLPATRGAGSLCAVRCEYRSERSPIPMQELSQARLGRRGSLRLLEFVLQTRQSAVPFYEEFVDATLSNDRT